MSGKWGGSQHPTPRSVRRLTGKGTEDCGAEHPSRRDGLGNPMKCQRGKGHVAKQHKAKTKSGDVWWS